MSAPSDQGILQARPALQSQGTPLPPGIHKLEMPARRTGGILYVPPGYRPDRPAPLVLLLHGAGGNGEGILPAFREEADRIGALVVAPTSRGSTWDVIQGGYGPDVAMIDTVLGQVFESFAIDPGHLGIGGFSDGASYALSLGVNNGTLFSHVMAFSPGFIARYRAEDAPRIFITHGTGDSVLPIEACSRRLVPRLSRAGYDLTYREFSGGHVIRPEILNEAFHWFVGKGGAE